MAEVKEKKKTHSEHNESLDCKTSLAATRKIGFSEDKCTFNWTLKREKKATNTGQLAHFRIRWLKIAFYVECNSKQMKEWGQKRRTHFSSTSRKINYYHCQTSIFVSFLCAFYFCYFFFLSFILIVSKCIDLIFIYKMRLLKEKSSVNAFIFFLYSTWISVYCMHAQYSPESQKRLINENLLHDFRLKPEDNGQLFFNNKCGILGSASQTKLALFICDNRKVPKLTAISKLEFVQWNKYHFPVFECNCIKLQNRHSKKKII